MELQVSKQMHESHINAIKQLGSQCKVSGDNFFL